MLQTNPRPLTLPAEQFICDDEPGPWAEDADDVGVAVNETERTFSGRSCRTQLSRVCLTFQVAGQVTGECPRVSRSAARQVSSRTPILE
jgi:hypothetical protein